MKTRLTHLLPAFLCLCLAPSIAHAQNVVTPDRRTALLDQVIALLEPAPASLTSTTDHLKDPFFPTRPTRAERSRAALAAAPTNAPPPAKLILEAALHQLSPTGTVVLGNEEFLLVGERRLRKGDLLEIEYRQRKYFVQLQSFDRQKFTLILDGYSVVKPIR